MQPEFPDETQMDMNELGPWHIELQEEVLADGISAHQIRAV